MPCTHTAMELLCLLITYEEVQQAILVGLVSLLKPHEETSSLGKLPQLEKPTPGKTLVSI